MRNTCQDCWPSFTTAASFEPSKYTLQIVSRPAATQTKILPEQSWTVALKLSTLIYLLCDVFLQQQMTNFEMHPLPSVPSSVTI